MCVYHYPCVRTSVCAFVCRTSSCARAYMCPRLQVCMRWVSEQVTVPESVTGSEAACPFFVCFRFWDDAVQFSESFWTMIGLQAVTGRLMRCLPRLPSLLTGSTSTSRALESHLLQNAQAPLTCLPRLPMVLRAQDSLVVGSRGYWRGPSCRKFWGGPRGQNLGMPGMGP